MTPGFPSLVSICPSVTRTRYRVVVGGVQCGTHPLTCMYQSSPPSDRVAMCVTLSILSYMDHHDPGMCVQAIVRTRERERSCTVFVMTPPDEHTRERDEGGRDDRGVPYHAESTLSSAQVLKRERTHNSWHCIVNKQTTTLPLYNYSHTQTFSLATPDDTKRDGAAHSHHHTNRHQLQHRHR